MFRVVKVLIVRSSIHQRFVACKRGRLRLVNDQKRSSSRRIFGKEEMRRTYLVSAVAGGLIALVALIYLLWPKVVIPRQEKAVPPVLQPVAAPTQTPLPDCAPKKYTVEPGDSLWKIAKKEWGGRPYFWPVLAEVNNLRNPNLILIDQVLTIPCLCDLPPRGTKLVAQKRKARKAVTASNSKPKRPAVSTKAVAPQAVLSGSASVAVKPASSKPSAMPRSLLKATGPPALSKAAAEAVPQDSKQKKGPEQSGLGEKKSSKPKEDH